MNVIIKSLRARVARREAQAAAIRAAAVALASSAHGSSASRPCDVALPPAPGLAAVLTGEDLFCALDARNTDLGNAERMLVRYGARLLDVVGLGMMQWTGSHWRLDGKEGALERAAHWATSA